MADNPAYAADDISSVLYPRIKITGGPDGTATADLGCRSASATLGGALYTDNVQKIVRKSVTPTVTAGAYSANDAVGGLLTFSNAARESAVPFVVKSVVVLDLAKQSAALNLVLFDRTFTATADNAAFDPTDADLANHVGTLPIAAASYYAYSDNAAATYIVPEGGLYVVPNGTDLFGQLYTTGTPTYAATSDVTVILTIAQ